MTRATPPAWSVFKQIGAEHWDGCKRACPRYARCYQDSLVAKRLGGGDPDQMGDIDQRCLPCGEGPHRVARSCQSSLCLRCAKVYVDTWGRQGRQRLHAGVLYRPMVLTMPALLRTTFSQPSQALLSPCMRCGRRCLDAVFSRISGRPLTGGSSMVIQTHGRNGRDTPHVHISATSGGWDRQAQQWVPLESVPQPRLRKKWQWHLLTLLRQTVKPTEIAR